MARRVPIDREALALELQRLPDLPSDELKRRWREFYGRDPTPRIGRPLMILAVGYGMQVKLFGGLKPTTKALLRRIAKQAREGKEAVLQTASMRPGTRLLRTWHGINHEVTMLEDGCLYQGRQYRSLTSVAREITGVHQSGPEFFGLKSKRTRHVGA